jgi:phosphatidylglycerophosphate synthase
MTPDILTGIGVLGVFIIFGGYVLSNISRNFLWLASLGFVINWYGDSLDGTLARFRHIERPKYGFYIDHVVDAFNEVLIFLGLGLTPYISFNIACMALIGYMLLSVLVFIRTCVVGEFRISYGKLGPTEMRVIAILLNTSMYIWGKQTIILPLDALGQARFSAYDIAVAVITILLFYFFVANGVGEARRLAKQGE